LIGESSDPGVLLRAGAMVRGRIDEGEWWRLVSCVFVHVGTIHLVVNAIGIFFLVRVLEDVFGTSRALAIYLGAGIAGAFASYLASPIGVSAGASGAVFGVLGALFIELTLHKSRYRAAWKSGMWSRLVLVTVAQAGIGFLYPVIDQWAHGAGLAAGIVLGAALSPSVPWARLTLYAGRVIALGLAALVITSGGLIARTSVADSLTRMPWVKYPLATVAITAPAGWREERPDELVEPDNLVILVANIEPSSNLISSLADWTDSSEKEIKAREFARTELAGDRLLLPPGWVGTERIGIMEDALDHTVRWRIASGARLDGNTVIRVRMYVPDGMASDAAAQLSAVLASVGPR